MELAKNETFSPSPPPEENLTFAVLNYSAIFSNNQRNFSAPTDFAQRSVVACLYFVLSFVYFVPYCACVVVIVQDKKLMARPYYHIIAHMAVADLVQLVLNGMAGGVLTLTSCDIMTNEWQLVMLKIAGGLMNSCWIAYCFLAHVLAFNRFVAICLPQLLASQLLCSFIAALEIGLARLIFSMCGCYLLLGSVWLSSVVWLAIFWTPKVSILYDINKFKWSYTYDGEWSRKTWLAELIVDSVHAVAMVMWYALIWRQLRKQVKQYV